MSVSIRHPKRRYHNFTRQEMLKDIELLVWLAANGFQRKNFTVLYGGAKRQKAKRLGTSNKRLVWVNWIRIGRPFGNQYEVLVECPNRCVDNNLCECYDEDHYAEMNAWVKRVSHQFRNGGETC